MLPPLSRPWSHFAMYNLCHIQLLVGSGTHTKSGIIHNFFIKKKQKIKKDETQKYMKYKKYARKTKEK